MFRLVFKYENSRTHKMMKVALQNSLTNSNPQNMQLDPISESSKDNLEYALLTPVPLIFPDD